MQQRDTGEMQQDMLRQLVIDAQAGNQKALESFVTMITPIIRRIIYSMLPRKNSDRDDLVQEVLLAVLNKMSGIRQPEAAIGWISIVTQRQVWNYRKRILQRRVGALPDDDCFGMATYRQELNMDGYDSLRLEEVMALVHRVLGEMKPDDAEALRMFHLDDLSLKQMRERISEDESRDVPLGTVKRRMHVARERFEAIVLRHPSYQNALPDSCRDD